MNNKETCLRKMMSIVVECCSTEVEGDVNIKLADMAGPSRKENVVLARSIVAMVLVNMGYSKTTVAQVLHRSVPAIRRMITQGYDLERTNKAFKVAFTEALDKCREEGVFTKEQ